MPTGPVRRVRPRAALLALLALGLLAATTIWLAADVLHPPSPDQPDPPGGRDGRTPSADGPQGPPGPRGEGVDVRPRGRARVPVETVVSPLATAWDEAVRLHDAGRAIEALRVLQPFRARIGEDAEAKAFFAEKTRAARVAKMEADVLAQLARTARTGTAAEAKELAEALAALGVDAKKLAAANALVQAALRREAAARTEVGAEILQLATKEERVVLERHLSRFGGRPRSKSDKDTWVDTQLAALEAAAAKPATDPVPLPLPDVDEAERRRIDQLEKLRQRGATDLLDAIAGGLAWLAIHQGDDGSFGNGVLLQRCKALGHAPVCGHTESAERHPFAATALAALAFLDFRDQDAKRLFEPALARAITWLRAQQNADGSFKGSGRSGYATAIGLMALGQAAAVSGDAELREVVRKGMTFYANQTGPTGGFRYSLGQEGDLSVTGWYAQAVEAARAAKADLPASLPQNLDRFLTNVWLGDQKFTYTSGSAERKSLMAVGMLTMSILRERAILDWGEQWRAALRPAVPSKNLYQLYYGVRVLLLLDGKLPDPWQKALRELRDAQETKGPAAGRIAPQQDPWFDRSGIGATTTTAFAVLTLEHALYRR